MTPVTDPATARCAVPRLRPSPSPSTESFDLDTVTETAESIIRDILQIVTAGRIDDDARAAFRDWIVEAWLALPAAVQTLAPHCVWCSAGVEQLCQAAGFAYVVEPSVLKVRIDELHHTISMQQQELAQCHERLALLHAAGQAIVAVWEHGDLAYAVRRLAALIPK